MNWLYRQSTELSTCPVCLRSFKYTEVPEKGMGYIECPHCKAALDQKMHKVSRITEIFNDPNTDIRGLLQIDRLSPNRAVYRYANYEEFYEEHGIVPEKAEPDHNSCFIGYSERDDAWYGWSHRAYESFKIGYVVEEGKIPAETFPVGFKAKTLEDCKKLAIAFAKSVS